MTIYQNILLENYARSTKAHLKQVINRGSANNEVAELLRKISIESADSLFSKENRRENGIYFSGDKWSQRIADLIPLKYGIRYFDPACGQGDLLYAIANRLFNTDLPSTNVNLNATNFEGMDIQPEFVSLTSDRFKAISIAVNLKYTQKEKNKKIIEIEFKNKNALISDWRLKQGDCIVMNPPFQSIVAPNTSTISSGKTTAAALFLERAILNVPAGVTIVAILPDVIRSGSRYKALRALLNNSCDVSRFEPEGRFSKDADIDVALLVATTIDKVNAPPATNKQDSTITVGDIFAVHVGSIVPHRAVKTSKSHLYIDVSDVTPWATLLPKRKAYYAGRLFKPPFVVVRRTSSPNDNQRAIATIIKGEKALLIENHLLVLLPRDGKLKSCIALRDKLKDQTTSDWLNYRIRCRHLTVSAVSQIPL